MSRKKGEEKSVVLRFRCTKTIAKRFSIFEIDYEIKNRDDALKKLLDLADKYPEDGTLRIRWG